MRMRQAGAESGAGVREIKGGLTCSSITAEGAPRVQENLTTLQQKNERKRLSKTGRFL